MSSEGTGKKLSELKVTDLRAELEKRDLETSGVKAVLVRRLSKALTDAGQVPDDFLFIPDDVKTPSKQMKEDGGGEEEEEKCQAENGDSTVETNCTITETRSDSEKCNEDNRTQEEMKTEEIPNEEKTAVGEQTSEDLAGVKVKKEPEEEVDEKKLGPADKQGRGDANCGSIAPIKTEPDEPPKEEETPMEVDETPKENSAENASEAENTVTGSPVKKPETKTKPTPKKVVAPQRNVKKTPQKSVNKDSGKAGTKESPAGEKTADKVSEPTSKAGAAKDKDAEVPEDTNRSKETVDEAADNLKAEEEELKEINGLDNDDSINFSIGEEDTKFMTEEDMEEKDALEGADTDKKSSDASRKGDKRHSSSLEKGTSDAEGKNDQRNLWVSNLSSATRATDLKHVFSKHGKVISAKVVTNARTPGSKCYGFVTMATEEDANACIKALNFNELHGRLISVESVASKPPGGKKAEDKDKAAAEKDGKPIDAREIIHSKSASRDREKEKERGREKERRDTRSRGSSRDSKGRSKSRRSPGILSFQQIKEERERQRLRERERELRELERRRHEERERQREVERRQREEAMRLEREREKLRLEREKIDRERAELLRLERDRLEKEKEELKRQQMKLEEAKRLKRTLSMRDDFEVSRKRLATEARHFDPRRAGYEAAHRSTLEFKKASPPRREVEIRRERFTEEVRPHRREPETSRVKERFENISTDERRRGVRREERRSKESPRPTHRDRFKTVTKGDRLVSSTEVWTGSSSRGSSDQWSHDRKGEGHPWSRGQSSSERWVVSTGGSSSSRSGVYPSGLGSAMQIPQVSFPNQDRFDAYKALSSMSRKY